MLSNRVLSITTLLDYIEECFPDLLFWDGISKHEPRNYEKIYKHRAGMPNEIRIEFDSEDSSKNWEALNETAIRLWEAGYSFAIYYTDGGRGPHLHMYDCDEMELLTKEQRTFYRIQFLKKYCPKDSKPDMGLCDEKHLCALEFFPHFKYGKDKKLLSFFDNGTLSNQGCDNEIYLDITLEKEEPEKIKKLLIKKRKKKLGDSLKDNQRDLIIDNLSFEEVFEKYGIKYKGTKAVCPFHQDKDPSISFTNENGLWKCWGTECGAKGDIITMIKMLREIKNGR